MTLHYKNLSHKMCRKEVLYMSTNITTNATNKTPNFGLPIFIGSDKPSWLTDWNGAMTEIDSLLKQIETVGSANSTQIEGLKTSLETANNAITALQEGLTTTTENTTKNTTDIGTLNSSLNVVQDDLIAQNALVKTLSTTVATLSETVANNKVVRKIVDLSSVSFGDYNYGTFYNIPALNLGEEFNTSKPIIATLCFKNVVNVHDRQNISTSVIGTNESSATRLSLGVTNIQGQGNTENGSYDNDDEYVTVSIYHNENGEVYFKVLHTFKGEFGIHSRVGETAISSFEVVKNTSDGVVGTDTLLKNAYLIFEQ